MNIYDILEHVGVSIVIMPKVLNGNASVSEKARERVLKVVDDLGYIPNVFARGLSLNAMRAIGIICSDSSDPYLASAIYCLGWGLRSHNYDTILCCTGYDLNTKQKYFEPLYPRHVDVIILTNSKFAETRSKDNAYITEAVADLPIMLVSGYLEGDNIYNTVYDDHAAMFGVVTQLLQAGRRRILYLYIGHPYSSVNKLEGYKDVLKVFSAEPKDELIHQCPKNIGASKELLLPLREQRFPFDAVMTSDDSLTVGTVKYVHEVGISTPEEPNIIGYNNSILSRCTDPEIISIGSKVEALYTTTINTLIGASSSVSVPSRATIASDLIKRKTVNF